MKRIDAEPIVERLESLGHDLQHSNPEAAHAYYMAADMLNGAPRIVYNAENRHCGDCVYFVPVRHSRTEKILYGDCLEGYTRKEPNAKSCMKFTPAHYTQLDLIHDMTEDEFSKWASLHCGESPEHWKAWAQQEVKRNG